MRWGYCSGCITSRQFSPTWSDFRYFSLIAHRQSFKLSASFAPTIVYINFWIILRYFTTTPSNWLIAKLVLPPAGSEGDRTRKSLRFFYFFIHYFDSVDRVRSRTPFVVILCPPSLKRLVHVAHITYSSSRLTVLYFDFPHFWQIQNAIIPTSPRQIRLFLFLLLILEDIHQIYLTLTLPPGYGINNILFLQFPLKLNLLFCSSTYLFFRLSVSNITPLSPCYTVGLVTYKPFVTYIFFFACGGYLYINPNIISGFCTP